MRRTILLPILAAVLVAATALLLLRPTDGDAALYIGVKGNKLVNGKGQSIRLLGVSRSGTEYKCAEEDGFFEGPTDMASIEVMKSWHINSVRVPLNESCWLGTGGIDPEFSGNAYRQQIREFVGRLQSVGLYVILDLHWAAPGNNRAGGIIPMPDADHALDFWRSVANEYKENHAVIFDLYNEPRPEVNWECWENGCEVEDQYFGRYAVVGMRQMVETVRSTGAEQPLILTGTKWGQNLRGWLSHVPPDPDHAEIAANHTYAEFTECLAKCKKAIVNVHRTYPVVTAEFGQSDCQSTYIDPYMEWADKEGISYLAWAWDSGPGWGCTEGPSLISDYSGTPTEFGLGFREHLRALYRARQKKR
jgi:aryl-phospho-beta-D-glucosidase BglC (GH1 family)